MKSHELRKLIYSSICLAFCILLPFVTGQIPQLGKALAPMHIPVLLCGFICGWPYGLIVGFMAPILRLAIFGMPPLFPTGLAMTFELSVYGTVTGLLYQKLPKTIGNIYITLITAMLSGRIVWGMAMTIICGINHFPFSFQAFLAGAFINAVPGIICHIILIPLIVIALRKAQLIENA